MSKVEELLATTRLNELLNKQQKEEEKSNTVLWVLAIIGAVAAIAAIAYGVYKYLTPDYLKDFEDDFEDVDDNYYSGDDEEAVEFN